MFLCDDLHIVTNISTERTASLVSDGLLDPEGEGLTLL
jgi:hypothetical protein